MNNYSLYMYSRNRKNYPKRDGSGRGIRANMGRGGCNPPRNRGIGYWQKWKETIKELLEGL